VSSPSAAPPRPQVGCRLALTDAELASHFEVRRAVFVGEQGLFDGDDRDERDADGATLHAIGVAAEGVAGAVRLYPTDGAGGWRGDRLAVLRAARHGLLGASLVRFAVATARERGGVRMDAMIQLANVPFFEALGWRADGAVERFHGRRHQPMAIDLVKPAA
jgi:putative N-acetyltransferase (TIGR04045 family)